MLALRIVGLPLLLLAASCQSAPSITGPDMTVISYGGIEQVLQLEANNPWDNSGRGLRLTSRLVNRGEEPVTLRVRTCYLREGIDLQTTPRAEFLGIALPGCVPEPDVITLQPGESSKTLFFAGLIQDPGRYRISVRHAIEPELWGTIEIVAR